MEHHQPEEENGGGGGDGGCGTTALRADDDHASLLVMEAQNLLVRNALTDMSVCVIEDRTMYTIRYRTVNKKDALMSLPDQRVWNLIYPPTSFPHSLKQMSPNRARSLQFLP